MPDFLVSLINTILDLSLARVNTYWLYYHVGNDIFKRGSIVVSLTDTYMHICTCLYYVYTMFVGLATHWVHWGASYVF